MTADRLALATRTKRARRTSTCPTCRGAILPGMTIAQLASPPHGSTSGVCPPSPG
jgi:hypothetical protein